MKKSIIAVCFFLIALTVHARAIREEPDLTGEQARESYAFGMAVGDDLKQAGLTLDYSAFTDGIRDVMEDAGTRLSYDEAFELIENAFENAMNRQVAELRNSELQFLTENAAREGIIVTESGLQYIVLETGDGPKPTAADTVLVHYEGKLIDGTVFDSSYQQDQPEEIPLSLVIPGWTEALQLMSTGGMYEIYVPSFLAYGELGVGNIIPPYSTVIFKIELFGIISDEQETENTEQ